MKLSDGSGYCERPRFFYFLY